MYVLPKRQGSPAGARVEGQMASLPPATCCAKPAGRLLHTPRRCSAAGRLTQKAGTLDQYLALTASL